MMVTLKVRFEVEFDGGFCGEREEVAEEDRGFGEDEDDEDNAD